MSMLVLVGLAAAGDWRFDLQASAAADLADGGFDDPTAQFDVGPGLGFGLAWEVRPGASVRLGLDLAGAFGSDRVTWTEGDVTFESSDHWAAVASGRLMLGPEFAFVPQAMVTPYLGAEAGVAGVANFHSFGDDTGVLLDPAQNDLDDPQNVDPYTLQAAPAAGVHFGVRIGRKVAFTIEAGYTAAFLAAAPLEKAPEALGAQRSAYVLDLVRASAGLSLPL